MAKNAYEKGIYQELGEEITQKLKAGQCEFVVNAETLEYSFTNCTPSLLDEILEMKKIKGEGSILTEFVPYESFVPWRPQH